MFDLYEFIIVFCHLHIHNCLLILRFQMNFFLLLAAYSLSICVERIRNVKITFLPFVSFIETFLAIQLTQAWLAIYISAYFTYEKRAFRSQATKFTFWVFVVQVWCVQTLLQAVIFFLIIVYFFCWHQLVVRLFFV